MSVETYVADLITYLTTDDGQPDVIATLPGPAGPVPVVLKEGQGSADTDLLNGGQGPLVVITHQFDAGPLTEEWALQRPVFQVRAVGPQGDFEGAKALTWAIDRRLRRVGSPSAVIGGYRVSSMSWTGGGPTLLLKDSARRSHFTCSYVSVVPSGL